MHLVGVQILESESNLRRPVRVQIHCQWIHWITEWTNFDLARDPFVTG